MRYESGLMQTIVSLVCLCALASGCKAKDPPQPSAAPPAPAVAPPHAPSDAMQPAATTDAGAVSGPPMAKRPAAAPTTTKLTHLRQVVGECVFDVELPEPLKVTSSERGAVSSMKLENDNYNLYLFDGTPADDPGRLAQDLTERLPAVAATGLELALGRNGKGDPQCKGQEAPTRFDRPTVCSFIIEGSKPVEGDTVALCQSVRFTLAPRKVPAPPPTGGHVPHKLVVDDCTFTFDAPEQLLPTEQDGSSKTIASAGFKFIGFAGQTLDDPAGVDPVTFQGTANGVKLVLGRSRGLRVPDLLGRGREALSADEDRQLGCVFTCEGTLAREADVTSLCKSVRIQRSK